MIPMHYFDCVTIEDKIIHILYAARFNDCFEQAINQCIQSFGKKQTKSAIYRFKTEFCY